MKLICFISLNDIFHHPFPNALVAERLRDEQFDLDRMILEGVTLDGERAWYAQERFGYERKM